MQQASSQQAPDTQENRRVDISLKTEASVTQGLASNLEEYFNNIRIMCESDSDTIPIGPDPYMLATHRINNWPTAADLPTHLAEIYEKVR